MTDFRLNRRAILMALTTLGAESAFSPLAANPPAGLVTAVNGEAVAVRAALRRELAQDSQVFMGDRIATGDASRASFQLGRTTELWLGERTRVTIDRFVAEAGGRITLGSGALFLDKDPDTGKAPIDIRSAYGVIAVRGTRVFAGPSNGVFGVFVERGQVDVRAGGMQVTLRAGEGTDIARPGAPPTASKTWGLGRINAALAQVA